MYRSSALAYCASKSPHRLLDVLELLPSSPLPRKNSVLARMLSTFGLELEELLRRRLRRTSSGSRGDSPLALAKRFSISVKLTTPDSRPLMLAPGSWLALMLSPGAVAV